MFQEKKDARVRLWDGLLECLGDFTGVARVSSYRELAVDWNFWNATIEIAGDLTVIKQAMESSPDAGVRARCKFQSDDESIDQGVGRVVFVKGLGKTGGLIGIAGLTPLVPGRDVQSAIELVYSVFDSAGREVELKIPDDQRVIGIRLGDHDFKVGFNNFLGYVSDAYDHAKDNDLPMIDVVEDALNQLRLDAEDKTP